MKQFNIVVDTSLQVQNFLATDEVVASIQSAKSILVQIYTDKLNIDQTKQIVAAIRTTMPQSLVVGTTSAGEITDGLPVLHSTLASFSFFESSELIPFSQTCKPGNEYEVGTITAESFRNTPNLKGILLLAPPLQINCAQLLKGMNDAVEDVIVFGGGTVGDNSQKGILFINDVIMDQGGVVAVGLAGEDLFIKSLSLFGWKPIGPHFTLTDVKDLSVNKINGKPAFNVYNQFLGLHPSDDLFLLEFPLLIERNGTILARNPLSSDKDDRLALIADVYCGEEAQLGYLNVDTVIENMKNAVEIMEYFSPEAILLYSCICRRYALQQDVELETIPFQKIAPAAGFFTHGEFYKNIDHLELLNSSQVVIGIREGAPKPQCHQTNQSINNDVDHYRLRHIQMTSRLLHFISALTDQVEEANQSLKFQAEHDQLTGVFNRHALNGNLEREISHSRINRVKLSFILFDIDHFKLINDTYGHPAGDQALKSIIEKVTEWTRSTDTLYRYGGEEFLLLLPETSLEGAKIVANKLKSLIKSMKINYNGIVLPEITASFGVACYPDQGDNAENIISTLDIAMYQSKQKGRDQVTLGKKTSKT